MTKSGFDAASPLQRMLWGSRHNIKRPVYERDTGTSDVNFSDKGGSQSRAQKHGEMSTSNERDQKGCLGDDDDDDCIIEIVESHVDRSCADSTPSDGPPSATKD